MSNGKPSLKLSFSNRLSHQSSTPSLQQSRTEQSSISNVSTSARVAEAEKTISILQDENKALRKDLADIRALYKQLVTEGKHESFDERRILLLKSQVIQLERQILLLTGALSSRSSILIDIENSIAAVVDFCRSFLQHTDGSREARLSHADLDRIVGTLESARTQLFRTVESTSGENDLAQPLAFFGDFVKNRPGDRSATLFDVCRGSTDHINLKQVGRLETRLVQVYKQLMGLGSTLRLCIQSTQTANCLPDVPSAVYGRLSGDVAKSCNLLEGVCSDLMQLSLLVPAAPLPILTRPFLGEITVENIMSSLRGGGGSIRLRDVRPVVESMLKAMNYSIHVAGAEKNILLNELEFHRSVYEHQSNYVNSLLSSLNAGYSEFETGLRDNIREPLSSVMTSFRHLKENLSHDSLLNFIAVFDGHTNVMMDVLKKLSFSGSCSNTSDSFFSEYQKNMCNVLKTCKGTRDKLVGEITLVKAQLDDQKLELSQRFDKENTAQLPEGISVTPANTVPGAENLTGESNAVTVRNTDLVNCKCGVSARETSPLVLERCGEMNLRPCVTPLCETTTECNRQKSKTSKVREEANYTVPSLSPEKAIVPGVAQRKLLLKSNADIRRKSSLGNVNDDATASQFKYGDWCADWNQPDVRDIRSPDLLRLVDISDSKVQRREGCLRRPSPRASLPVATTPDCAMFKSGDVMHPKLKKRSTSTQFVGRPSQCSPLTSDSSRTSRTKKTQAQRFPQSPENKNLSSLDTTSKHKPSD